MTFLLRVAGVYTLLMGAAIGLHFIFTPFYHSGDDSSMAWQVMNWFIAPAVLVMVAGSYLLKRRSDGAGFELQRYLESNVVFYGSVAASIIYFWNWFLLLATGNAADGQFWSILGAVLPILMVVAGYRLWGRRAEE